MRTKNSIYNLLGSFLFYFVKIIFLFIGQTCLIKILGNQYNGVKGLFSNIISMLSLAELGIGAAIVYNLYEPVRNNDIDIIKSIMQFYKKCYHIIAMIVLLAGFCILPFIKSIVGTVNISENIYLLFLLFLLDSVASYLLSYKRSIIYVEQKNYIISLFDTLYIIVLQILQIAVLYFLHNFIVYLVVGIICRIGENTLIHIYANIKYPFLKEGNVHKLQKNVIDDIIEKVKGLLFHNIGSYVVLGTDNILMSKLVNIIAVGFYSNYLMVINALSNVLSQIIQSVQASVGDLLVEKNYKKNYEIYKRLEFANFWIYSVVSVTVYYLIQDFIVLWLGKNYLFDNIVVFCIILNFWQTGMRNVISAFKTGAGIFYEDRYVPIIESIVNIILSILLTVKLGIIGIFLGTFVSTLCLFLYSYPILVYKPLFKRNAREYYKYILTAFFKWIVTILFVSFIDNRIDEVNYISNKYILFVIKGILIFFVTNIIFLIFHLRTDEFKFWVNKIKSVIKR